MGNKEHACLHANATVAHWMLPLGLVKGSYVWSICGWPTIYKHMTLKNLHMTRLSSIGNLFGFLLYVKLTMQYITITLTLWAHDVGSG